MNFLHFDVTTNRDYLYIGHGHVASPVTMVMRLTGSTTPNSLSVNSSTAWLYFNGWDGFWWGFVIPIRATNQTGKSIQIIGEYMYLF